MSRPGRVDRLGGEEALTRSGGERRSPSVAGEARAWTHADLLGLPVHPEDGAAAPGGAGRLRASYHRRRAVQVGAVSD